MSGKLCEKCQEWRKNHLIEHGYPDEINQCPPYFHCHHEKLEEKPKEKCWCDYLGLQRYGTMKADTGYGTKASARQWFFKFCGACGRRLWGI